MTALKAGSAPPKSRYIATTASLLKNQIIAVVMKAKCLKAMELAGLSNLQKIQQFTILFMGCKME